MSSPSDALPALRKIAREILAEEREETAAWTANYPVITQVEWEYAARGPEERRYPWGPDFAADFDHDGAPEIILPGTPLRVYAGK